MPAAICETMKTSKIVAIGGIVLSILFVYRHLFSFSPLSSGDWSFNFKEALFWFPTYPFAWDPLSHNGLGGNNIYFLGLSTIFYTTGFIFSEVFHFQWALIERIVWYIPFLIFSFISSFLLGKKLLHDTLLAVGSAGIFLLNTYILIVISGGQMGVAIALSLIPLIFYFVFDIKEKIKQKKKLLFFQTLLLSCTIAIQVMYDPRITYITYTAVSIIFLYFLYLAFIKSKKNMSMFWKDSGLYILCFYIIPVIVTFLVNIFWILPYIVYGNNPYNELGSAYNTLDAVRFFSFGNFDNAIALLDPNWPENIFGKVTFFNPIFLFFPIVAFSSIMWSKEKRYLSLLPFVLLAIIFAFLGKGSKEPFGAVYEFLFQHLPGFVAFRDPTKWYSITVVAYSILIPFSLSQVYVRLSRFLRILFIGALISIFFAMLFPFLQGVGIFKDHTVPLSYISLKDRLSGDGKFSRILWIPQPQRYGFSSPVHPSVGALSLFQESSLSGVLTTLGKKETEMYLQNLSIGYVVIPEDSQGELFTNDRKYSQDLRKQTEDTVDGISYLTKISTESALAVYKVPSSKDRIWIDGKGSVLAIQYLKPTSILIDVLVDKGDQLVFTDTYDSQWHVQYTGTSLSSQKDSFGRNRFTLPQTGSYTLYLSYASQPFIDEFVRFSGGIVLLLAIVLMVVYKKRW